jgi:hypothetical protein
VLLGGGSSIRARDRGENTESLSGLRGAAAQQAMAIPMVQTAHPVTAKTE